MATPPKKAERDKKSRAYRALVKSLASISGIYNPTASSIFDCLSKAHLNERNAKSSELARGALFRENPAASVPDELSDKAIAEYLANAGSHYGAAAIDCMLIADLRRAFKCFRRASQHCRRAAALQAQADAALSEKAREYNENATIVRQEAARKNLLRRRPLLRLLAKLR